MKTVSLPSNHTIKSLLKYYHILDLNSYHLLLDKVTFKQRLKIKSSIVDVNNYLNGILSSFYLLYKELSPSFHLVDIFQNYLTL